MRLDLHGSQITAQVVTKTTPSPFLGALDQPRLDPIFMYVNEAGCPISRVLCEKWALTLHPIPPVPRLTPTMRHRKDYDFRRIIEE